MSENKVDCICCGAGPALTEFLKNLGPPDSAKTHFTQSRVEFLKGLRAIIDRQIEKYSKTEKGTTVPVE